jgi:TIR domain
MGGNVAEDGGEEQTTGARAGTKAVFISYASQDAQAAAHICDALRTTGIEVCFDRSELRGGDAWDRQIHERIHDCRLFIAVISANTEARDEGYFRREWKLAVDRTHDMADSKAFLVPVAIDDTPERGASVPEKFRHVQWMRLPGGETPRDFVTRVATLLGAEIPRPASRVGAEGTATTVARSPATSQRLWPWFAIPSIAIAGGWLAWRYAGTREPVQHGASDALRAVAADKSIAVLPFVDMSENKDRNISLTGCRKKCLISWSRCLSSG